MPALHFRVVIVPDRAKRRMTTEVPKNRNDFVDLDSADIETNCRRYPATSSPTWEVSQLASHFTIFPLVWTCPVTISRTSTRTSGACPSKPVLLILNFHMEMQREATPTTKNQATMANLRSQKRGIARRWQLPPFLSIEKIPLNISQHWAILFE